MTDTDLQQKRLIAAAIDVAVGIALSIVLGVAGFVVGMAGGLGGPDSIIATYLPRLFGFVASAIFLAYLLGRDLLGGGRSIGKKIQDIRVVTGAGPIGPAESVKRNAIFGLGSVLALLSATLQLVPCLGDAVACLLFPLQILGVVITVVAVIVEVIKITMDPNGIRFGDQLANTRVVR